MKERIRRGNIKDRKIILSLLNSDHNVYGREDDRFQEKEVNQYLKDNLHKIFVYEFNKKVIAVMIAQFFKIAKYIYLYFLVVDKSYQAQGIATKLIDYLEAIAKKQGYSLIEGLTKKSNARMQNFFVKNKYKRGDLYLHFYKDLI